MRVLRVVAAITGVGFLVLAISAGCSSQAEDCMRAANCETAGTTGTTGSGGADAGTDPMCIPSQSTGPVENTCGIFVSAVGNDADTGTKGSPVATLKHAIELATSMSKPIYACAETFTETIEVPAGVEIYGGLDCASGWSWSEAGRTTLTAGPDQIPMKLVSGTGTTTIENFTVIAADAMQIGGSSIAVISDNNTVEIARSDFTAGKGRDGANGETPLEPPAKGANGTVGTNACEVPIPMMTDGAGGVTQCENGTSQGGNGGKGGVPAIKNGDGEPGTNGQPDNALNGVGGVGQTDMTACTEGTTGKDGDPGGVGLGGAELGTISIAGIAGGDGQNGAPGMPGQGGGGGGGAKGGNFCPGMSDGPGASGGGGGAGGCGGKGGGGGRAGGSSIALVSLNATLTMTQVTLTASSGGTGGQGALGQLGAVRGDRGEGGTKVLQSSSGCKGGDGGIGGDGGPGGGGRGGHSIGLAYKGTPPPAEGFTIAVGAPGAGGQGATMDPIGTGAAGAASMVPLAFE
jgi:hypothetical protein